MTEVFLDGFNIIARFKGSHGKRMTEIMKSSGIQTNFFDSVLEPFIYIDISRRESMAYDAEADTYTCANGKTITFDGVWKYRKRGFLDFVSLTE